MGRRGGMTELLNPTGAWSGAQVRNARTIMSRTLPAPCGRCGKTVEPDAPGTPPGKSGWVVGHIKSRLAYPELTGSPDNWRVEHRTCSDGSAAEAIIEKALRDAGIEHASGSAQPETGPAFPVAAPTQGAPALPLHTPKTNDEPPYPTTDFEALVATPWATWLHPFANVPEDAGVPLFMSPPHPRAVGSYGDQACAWAESELKIKLRWWQRLAMVRQLEHDEHGRLCWSTVVESGPRRSGKSVRLRALALWRISVADLLGEPQTVLHCGKDLPIAREIHMRAWQWVERNRKEDGWKVKRGFGNEEIVTGDESRWLVRSVNGVYGYDVGLGMVDEAWDVEPRAVDEGLEPATLERCSPQIHLTSTAHRRASSLMRKRIATAVATMDSAEPDTLLLLWGAHPDDDPSLESTWRKASPHWSEDRRRMISAKYEAAAAGQSDPEADDPDPMEGFLAQYLNVWRLRVSGAIAKGTPVITDEAWTDLTIEPLASKPTAVAVESWFTDGVSVTEAWRTDEGTILVSSSDYPTLEEAAEAIVASGLTSVITGASLADDPTWQAHNLRAKPATGSTTSAAVEFARLLNDGVLRHDGGEHLTDQVLALRTTPSTDGVRLTSNARACGVKSAVWAASAARRRSGRPRIITGSNI